MSVKVTTNNGDNIVPEATETKLLTDGTVTFRLKVLLVKHL